MSNHPGNSSPDKKKPEDFHILFNQVLEIVNADLTRIDFLKNLLQLIRDFSSCNAVELWLKEGKKGYNYEVARNDDKSFRKIVPKANYNSGLIQLCKNVIRKSYDSSLPFFTTRGSFYSGNMTNLLSSCTEEIKIKHFKNVEINENHQSIALFPLTVGDDVIGLLQLESNKRNGFPRYYIELFEDFLQLFGLLLINQRSQSALRERIKELLCLYEISQLFGKHEKPFDDILQNIVCLLPSAWQYSDIACGSIVYEGKAYTTPEFKKGIFTQSADIIVNNEKRGSVNVIYTEDKPVLDEGPFLKEERNLINSIASKISFFIEQRQALRDKAILHEQLLHAERLSTIGKLAAGVAHELNEPLGSILGFSQLIMKFSNLPNQVTQDLERIISASLHAREIVRKLLIFARQMPLTKTEINLNLIIEEGLYFLEFRCAKNGIQLDLSLDENLPMIIADASQMTQVIVNLVVNSIQSMPDGGDIKIRTFQQNNYVSLIVEDKGIGMSDEVKNNIFHPFFTTKEIGQGIGLGMSVVNGIVTSHNGSINIESQIGSGTKIEIKLPIHIKEEDNNESA